MRTFPGVSLRPGGSLGFNPDTPRRLSTPLLTPFNATPMFARIVALGKHICWWFTDDAAVHAVAVAILPVIAVYQAADGLRVVGGGCLRGVGMLREMIAADFIGFWCLWIPCGAWLCLGTTWKVYGLWWGFAFGVVVVLWLILRLAWRVGEEKPAEGVDGGAGGARAA